VNCPETYILLHFGHTFSVAYTLLTNINIGLLRCIALSYAIVVVSLFFGHLVRMDENADDSQAIFEPPPGNWRRPPGRPRTTWMKNIHDDMSSLDLGIHEARDLVQNRSLQTDVFLCTALRTRSGACYYSIGYVVQFVAITLSMTSTGWVKKVSRRTVIHYFKGLTIALALNIL